MSKGLDVFNSSILMAEKGNFQIKNECNMFLIFVKHIDIVGTRYCKNGELCTSVHNPVLLHSESSLLVVVSWLKIIVGKSVSQDSNRLHVMRLVPRFRHLTGYARCSIVLNTAPSPIGATRVFL